MYATITVRDDLHVVEIIEFLSVRDRAVAVIALNGRLYERELSELSNFSRVRPQIDRNGNLIVVTGAVQQSVGG